MQRPSSILPLLTARSALFLDFDGTLVDLAPTPDAVVVSPRLVSLLSDLNDALDGALAIVTGRDIASIDFYLAPLRLALGAEHGSQWRLPSGTVESIAPPDIHAAVETARALHGLHPRLILEQKHTSISLHYRQAPELETLCVTAMENAAIGVPNVTVLRGKFVVEVKSSLSDKGHVLQTLMNSPPFYGRVARVRGRRRDRRICHRTGSIAGRRRHQSGRKPQFCATPVRLASAVDRMARRVPGRPAAS